MLDNFSSSHFLFYLFISLPFLSSVFLFLAGNVINNPINLRTMAKVFFCVHFALATIILFCFNSLNFSIFDFSFRFDRITSILLFLASFVYLVFIFISKSFIFKLHKLFYSTMALSLGLLDIVLLSDNIFCFLITLFWFLAINYFLANNFISKKRRKYLNIQFLSEIVTLLICLFLIGYDFMRYFLINGIEFKFSQISQYLYHINDFSIKLAFLGFLILIFKLFNFFPFNLKQNIQINCTSPFIVSFDTVTTLFIGGFLLIRCYNSFDYLLYQYQGLIAFYLILNLIYFTILSFEKQNLLKFAVNILPNFLITMLFSVFCFEQIALASFIYSLITVIISFVFLFFIICLLNEKFKTVQISEFKKIKNRLFKFFIAFAFLNIAKTPFLAMFSSCLISFAVIFSINYDSALLNKAPYILIFCTLVLTINCFDILNKILVDTKEPSKNIIALSNHQVTVFFVLVFLIVITAIFIQYIFEQFGINLNLGNF